MSRRSATSVTFKVTCRVPSGSNIPALKQFILDGLKYAKGHVRAGGDLANPFMHFEPNEVTITLDKRVTTYL